MDDSFEDLEARLKALAPRPPSAHLQHRINRELARSDLAAPSAAGHRYGSATNLTSWKWTGWRTAGFAAALLVIAAVGYLRIGQPTPTISGLAPAPLAVAEPTAQTSPAIPVAADFYRPVAASNVLYDLKDEGPVILAGDTAARRLRYRYVDTYTWQNPRSHASIKWSVPRDEIRVIPASLH